MKRKILFFAGLLCLLLAIADLVVWIIIATPEKSFGTAVSDYVSLFPKFIANPVTLTLLNILFLLMAIGFFIFSIQKITSLSFRRVCYILIILSGILAGWNLFSLM